MGRRRPVVGCRQRTVEGYSLTLSFLEDVARPFGFDFVCVAFMSFTLQVRQHGRLLLEQQLQDMARMRGSRSSRSQATHA